MNPRTIPPILEVSQLGTLPSAPDFPPAGESNGIWRVPAWPGHLFKRFNAEAARKIDGATLDRLVAQPHALADPGDRQLIAEATSWPISRVVDGAYTIGVLTPEAPGTFSVAWLAKSRSNPNRYGPLPVDFLAKENAWLAERGIPHQSGRDRAAMCLCLAKVACLFERCGIVYADWSYANAFWQPTEHTVYVIDLDSCTYGPRPHVFTPEFEDPLTPDGRPVDAYTDRYRAALLIARMLTGLRRKDDVYTALRGMAGTFPQTLLKMLTATERTGRPSLAELTGGVGFATPTPGMSDGTGVSTWRPTKIRRPARPANASPSMPDGPGWRPRPGYAGPRAKPSVPGPAPRPGRPGGYSTPPPPRRSAVNGAARPPSPASYQRPVPPVIPPPAATPPVRSDRQFIGAVITAVVLIAVIALCAYFIV